MSAASDGERKRKEREAKAKAGLVRVEVWVPRGEQAKIAALAEALRAKPNCPKCGDETP
jgi:hypothetical protein